MKSALVPVLCSTQTKASFNYKHILKIELVLLLFKMVILSEFFYVIIVVAIRTFKFIELGIIKLIIGPLTKEIISRGEKLGITFHKPNEHRHDISSEDEDRFLKVSKYSSILHLNINNLSFFTRLANEGPLGFAEEYLNGTWELLGTDDQMVELFCRFLDNNIHQMYYHPVNRFLNYLELEAFNLQTTRRAFQVAEKHYDLGNDLFESYLDPWMQFSCGYWANADNLNDSQLHKLELIAKKLELKPGMRVLDVGCGWGTLCKYLAENYGVECVGITVSKEGVKYAEKVCKGLKTEFRVQDYRDVNEKFDRIVSIQCLEHLGRHNYRTFFKVMNKCLKDEGIFLSQIVGANHHDFPLADPFLHKYIFPNSMLPYYLDVAKSIEGLFIIEDWQNFGQDYAKTANAWRHNFQSNWNRKLSDKYGEQYFKMFNLFLLMTEAIFKSRKIQCWHLVLSKDGLRNEYRAAR